MRLRIACKKLLITLSALGLVYGLYQQYAWRGLSYQYEQSHQVQAKKISQDGSTSDLGRDRQASLLPIEISQRDVGPGIPSGCRQSHCREYLSSSDNNRWKKCSQKVASAFKPSEVKNGECRFMNGTGRKPVALLSHPGSGNTWIRILLEKATGVCTGAIYCDMDLRAQGFVGEGVWGASVIAVKSHDSSSPWEGASCESNGRFCYGAAIMLVRNPYDAFVAEWNRQVTEHILKPGRAKHQHSHVNVVPDFYFSGPEWDDYLQNQTVEWETRMRRWIVLGDHPLLVVHFEDVQLNMQKEVERMLEFLKVGYTMTDLRLKMQEAKNLIAFKRKRADNFDPYAAEQKELINNAIQKVKVFLSQYNMEDLLKVEKYMRI